MEKSKGLALCCWICSHEDNPMVTFLLHKTYGKVTLRENTVLEFWHYVNNVIFEVTVSS